MTLSETVDLYPKPIKDSPFNAKLEQLSPPAKFQHASLFGVFGDGKPESEDRILKQFILAFYFIQNNKK
jgi:hypothetical protein